MATEKIYCKNCKYFRKYYPWEFESWDDYICSKRKKYKVEGKINNVTGIKQKDYVITCFPMKFSHDVNAINLHEYMNKNNDCQHFKKSLFTRR